MSINRIRKAVRDGHYQYTIHALEEMDADDLVEEDVYRALLHGDLVAELTEDPRGIRFVVQGQGMQSLPMIEVVCRFLPSGLLRLITVYALEE